MTVMVQEEVADRFCALPASNDYGAVTVGINLRGSAKKTIYVPREKFTPVPNVDSAVVKIDIEKNKFAGEDFVAIRDAVKCGFNSRRKTLVNNIMNYYKADRKTAESVIADCGFNPLCRGEQLTAENYARLSNALKGKGLWQKR